MKLHRQPRKKKSNLREFFQRQKPLGKVDYVIVGLVLAIIGFGLVMLSSASSVEAYRRFDNTYYYFWRQVLRGLIPGAVVMFVLSRIDYRVWEKHSMKFLVGSLILLLLVFIPGLGSSNNTTAVGGRWINIGSMTFQPTEIVKLLLVLFLAGWFSYRGREMNADFWNGLAPFAAILAIISLLIVLQPDLGTLIVIVTISLVMYLAAGARWSHFFAVIFAGLASLVALIIKEPYRMDRLMTFLHPDQNPLGIGYHINQALLAVGSGGFFGLGFGQSRQKFAYLPEVMGDSIFAIIAEELGFIFAAGLLIAFVALAIRCLQLTRHIDNDYGRLVVIGIVTWFTFQTFFNISAMIGLMPLTGIPLPFISYGGTALLMAMAAAGILINISRQPR